MSAFYYLTAMVDNCVPWQQLNGCSVTRPFLSLRRVWHARLLPHEVALPLLLVIQLFCIPCCTNSELLRQSWCVFSSFCSACGLLHHGSNQVASFPGLPSVYCSVCITPLPCVIVSTNQRTTTTTTKKAKAGKKLPVKLQ